MPLLGSLVSLNQSLMCSFWQHKMSLLDVVLASIVTGKELVEDKMPALSVFEWAIGLGVMMLTLMMGWLHMRHTGEVEERNRGQDAIWLQINQINRDMREVFTKADAKDMETRIREMFYNRTHPT